MNYDWNKNVNITVPVGLNGWYFSGEVTINGVKVTFPVGKPTTVPEPVAEMLKAMIKAAMPNTANPHYEPHKMYVTDENGDPVWTDLLAYKTTGTVEVLGETELLYDTQDNVALVTIPWETEPVAGGVYNVVYNGSQYACDGVAYDMEGVPAGVVALGNVSLIGLTGGNEGAPFAMLCVPNAMSAAMGGFYGMLYNTDGATSITLSISGEVTTVKKIDSDYLPDGVGKKIVLTIDADGNVTTDTTFAEAWNMTDAQLANAIVIKETGSYMGNDVDLSGSAHVTRIESGYQSLQISFTKWHDWYDVLGQSDITRYINWNSGGISLSKAQTYSLPEMATDSSGATGAVYYARCINGKWQYCDIDQLKADLGLS